MENIMTNHVQRAVAAAATFQPDVFARHSFIVDQINSDIHALVGLGVSLRAGRSTSDMAHMVGALDRIERQLEVTRKSAEIMRNALNREPARPQPQANCPTCGDLVPTIFEHVDGCPNER